MGKKQLKGPAEITIRLFDPGMSPMHRAGLGGLACSLRALEKAYGRSLPKEKAPGGPWPNDLPPWEIKPLEVILKFGIPEAAEEYLKRLFEFSFQIKDGLIYLPGQYDNKPPREVLVELQNGLLLTFLQHGLVRKLSKEDVNYSYLVDENVLNISYKECSHFKHQGSWEEMCSRGLFIDNSCVEVVGPLNPGAVIRHVAFSAQTKIVDPATRVLPLIFSMIGCLALAINKGCGVLVVPEVKNILHFVEERKNMTPTCSRDCRIADGSDAVLQTQARLHACRAVESAELPGCLAVTFRPTPWASQQKSRVESCYVGSTRAKDLEIFEIALLELRPRVIPAKNEKSSTKNVKSKINKEGRADAFWVDSAVRPLVANNIAKGNPWYRGFVSLMQKVDPVSGKPVREKIAFEKEGLHRMIDSIPWKDQGEKTIVEAVHEAVRMRFGRIADESHSNPVAMKNRLDRERERWRLAFSGSKTLDQFRGALCDLFSRAGTNEVLQEAWPTILPLLRGDRWQLARDLALLALASYKKKEKEAASDANKEGEQS